MNLSIDDVFCTEVCREIAEHLLDPCAFFNMMLNDKFHLLSLSHRSLVQLPLQQFIMSTVEVVLSTSPVDLVPQVLPRIFELFGKVVVLLPNRRRGSFNKLKVAPGVTKELGLPSLHQRSRDLEGPRRAPPERPLVEPQGCISGSCG